MRWLRQSFGLKIGVAIWLLILIIPRWRQDAREQWSEQTFSSDSYKNGLTLEKIDKIAARSPDDVAVQLERLSARILYNYSVSLEKDAAKRNRVFEDYAALSRRFSGENSVRQAWLIYVTSGALDIEPASSYPDPRSKPTVENWLPDTQLEAALGAARAGARLDPRNSFFPWMEAALNFALKRPAPALTALKRAANCSAFDDGTLQTARRRIELLSRVQNVGWGDKTRTLWGLLLPHLNTLRVTSRAAMNVSRQAYKSGDKARGLQIAADLARAGATLSASKDSLITLLVGDAIQQIAWRNALKNAGRDIETRLYSRADNAQENLRNDIAMRQEETKRLVILARQSNQETIARQVLATLPNVQGRRLSMAYHAQNFDGTWQGTAALAGFFWIQSELLRLSLAGALAWLVAFGLTRQTALPDKLRRTSALWSAFCVGVTTVMLIIASLLFGAAIGNNFLDKTSALPLSWREHQSYLNLFLGALWLFPVLLGWVWHTVKTLSLPQLRLETRGSDSQSTLKTLIYGGVASGCLLSIPVSYHLDSVFQRIWPAQGLFLSAMLLIAGVFHIITSKGKTRLAAALFWSVPLILLAARTMLHPIFEADLVAILLGIALCCLITSAYLTQWRPAPPTRQGFSDFLGRLRLLAATLAVAGSLAYLGVKVAALPAETRMNALIDTQLKNGEVSWIEAQTAQQ